MAKRVVAPGPRLTEQPRWRWDGVHRYLEHEKPGKYGDEVQTKFGFVLEEQVKSEVWPERDGDAFAATMAALKAGQEVRLSYNHVYVTRTDVVDGRETSSKYPERGLTLLEPTAPSE
jgi:hypothetical protein